MSSLSEYSTEKGSFCVGGWIGFPLIFSKEIRLSNSPFSSFRVFLMGSGSKKFEHSVSYIPSEGVTLSHVEIRRSSSNYGVKLCN